MVCAKYDEGYHNWWFSRIDGLYQKYLVNNNNNN